jgi:D-alanyl-lipoteichoic acid acyltransferase DltB (MBOAT superfamily)
VLIADPFATFANPVFNAARNGTDPGFAVAWIGTLAYTMQIYFDFSGYTDMAIGLGRMFGIRLPLNFN